MSNLTKPNEQRYFHGDEFTWEQFAKNCLLNKYALVVGSEAILNREINCDAEGDSTRLLLDKTLYHIASKEIKEEYRDSGQDAPESEILEAYRHLKKRYKSFTQLDRRYKNIKESVWETTKKMMKDNPHDFLINFIEPTLLNLLNTRCFRVVITTAIDPFLELAMEETWKDDGGFEIVQIDNAKPKFKQVEYDEFNVPKPMLCYMFGKVDIQNPPLENSFALSENNAIEKIANWFNTVDNNGFLKYIRNYNILSVGPQFDDWMFRFFWYLLRGEIGKSSGTQQVAVEINKERPCLADYLQSENVEVFPNAREFMQDVVENIGSTIPLLRSPRRDHGVFISYSHKDKYIARPLFEKLCSEGIPAWIDDEELDTGDDFNERITNAIKNCKFFIPILSTSIKEQITCGTMEEQWYYKNEWYPINEKYIKEKQQNDEIKKVNENSHLTYSFKTIPFVVGDYNCSKDYHKSVPDCIKDASINDSCVLAKDKIEYLIEIINKHFIKQ